jgi:hypothetical protein
MRFPTGLAATLALLISAPLHAANFHYNQVEVAHVEAETDSGDKAEQIIIAGSWTLGPSAFIAAQYGRGDFKELGGVDVDVFGIDVTQDELSGAFGLRNEVAANTDIYYGLRIGLGKIDTNIQGAEDQRYEFVGVFTGLRQWIVRGYLELDARFSRTEGKQEDERFGTNDVQMGLMGYPTPNLGISVMFGRSFGTDDDRDAVGVSLRYDY